MTRVPVEKKSDEKCTLLLNNQLQKEPKTECTECSHLRAMLAQTKAALRERDREVNFRKREVAALRSEYEELLTRSKLSFESRLSSGMISPSYIEGTKRERDEEYEDPSVITLLNSLLSLCCAETVIVSGIPRVPREGYNKLMGMLAELTDGHGECEKVMPFIPFGDETIGLLFIIFEGAEAAEGARSALDGINLNAECILRAVMANEPCEIIEVLEHNGLGNYASALLNQGSELIREGDSQEYDTQVGSQGNISLDSRQSNARSEASKESRLNPRVTLFSPRAKKKCLLRLITSYIEGRREDEEYNPSESVSESNSADDPSSRSIIVSGIPRVPGKEYDKLMDALAKLTDGHGECERIMPVIPSGDETIGLLFVIFESAEAAKRAQSALNGIDFNKGHLLRATMVDEPRGIIEVFDHNGLDSHAAAPFNEGFKLLERSNSQEYSIGVLSMPGASVPSVR